MDNAHYEKSMNSHYDINNKFRIINASTVTVLRSRDYVFLHIYDNKAK